MVGVDYGSYSLPLENPDSCDMAPNFDQKLKFIVEAGKVLPAHCHKFVARVFAARRDDGWDHRGTALMIQIGQQQAFVTALHVLSDIENDEAYRAFGFSPVAEGGFVNILRFEDLDVAVIFLQTPITPRGGHEFWPIERSDPNTDRLLSDYLLVHGYPDIFTRFTAFLPGFVGDSYTHCASIRPQESSFTPEILAELKTKFPNYMPVPDSLLRTSQFTINYAEDTGPLKTAQGDEVTNESILNSYSRLYADGVAFEGQERHGAFGLSGSPVWRYGASECEWIPERWCLNLARITGIVTGWNEGHGILIASPIGEIIRRIVQALVPTIPQAE